MDTIIAWAIANPELAIVVGGALADIIAGWLPDNLTRYPGLILGTARKMYYHGKEEVPPEAKVVEDLVQRAVRRELARYAKPRST